MDMSAEFACVVEALEVSAFQMAEYGLSCLQSCGASEATVLLPAG
jgi:hypothetical protein